MEARTSASDAAPPLGGIIPLPLTVDAVRSSAPRLISGAHAALSPVFGAITAWQPAQALSHTALPSAAIAGPVANEVATAPRTTSIARIISLSLQNLVSKKHPRMALRHNFQVKVTIQEHIRFDLSQVGRRGP